MPEDYKVLHGEMKKRRKRSLLTQQEVADAVGMSKSEISRIENGRHRPYFNTVKKIAAALGADPEEFVLWIELENGNGSSHRNGGK